MTRAHLEEDTNRRFQGSFAGELAAAASFRGSNPVTFGFDKGAIVDCDC